MADALVHEHFGRVDRVLSQGDGRLLVWIIDEDGNPRAYWVTRAPEHDNDK